MPNDYITNEDRKRILSLYLDDRTAKDVANVLQHNYPAVLAIINKYGKRDLIERCLKGGPLRKAVFRGKKTSIQS